MIIMVKGESRLNRVSDITNRTENFNITAGGSLASWHFTKGEVVKFGSIGPQNASDWSLFRTAFSWVQGALKFINKFILVTWHMKPLGLLLGDAINRKTEIQIELKAC